MATNLIKLGLGIVLTTACLLVGVAQARADEATVSVGRRYAEPPPDDDVYVAQVVVDDPRYDARELRRSSVRLQLGPQGVTTGRGFGLGVGIGADFGSGSVGGRLAASWLRGEGKNGDGTSTATGDSIGVYTGEVTLDLHKRGPIHPVIGMGVGLLQVSRPDTSGIAGVGTGRAGLEYALGLEDADVRVGASVTGGLIGPVDSDVKDLRGYALVGAYLAIGF